MSDLPSKRPTRQKKKLIRQSSHFPWSMLSFLSPLKLLDDIGTDRPILIMEETSHSVWVNSIAMRKAGWRIFLGGRRLSTRCGAAEDVHSKAVDRMTFGLCFSSFFHFGRGEYFKEKSSLYKNDLIIFNVIPFMAASNQINIAFSLSLG